MTSGWGTFCSARADKSHEYRQGQVRVPANAAYRKIYPDVEFVYVWGYYCVYCLEERVKDATSVATGGV